jgi:plasmid stabilization system protein ParE
VKLEFSPRAQRDIERCARWWRQNREKAPWLFDEELEKALDQIRTVPELSVRYQAMSGREHRRVLMLKTDYHVYFRIIAKKDVVRIVTVWSARRKRGPKL